MNWKQFALNITLQRIDEFKEYSKRDDILVESFLHLLLMCLLSLCTSFDTLC